MAISLARWVDRQDWMEPAEEGLDTALGAALEALGPRREAVEDFLHGERLGHPLHVMLTDIPIGAWTTALVLDRVGAMSQDPRRWEGASRAAIAIGLVGALGAALSGLEDWRRIQSPVRRVGLAHGLLNVLGVAAFTTSLLRRRRRGAGRRSALAGYALMLTAARLGGHMVYQEGIGQRPAERLPERSREAA